VRLGRPAEAGRRPARHDHDHSVNTQGGPGRATGERLCRQRGRLTPRDAGSSAKPLPNPHQGYDHPNDSATRAVENASNRPKNCLTTKEDSICTHRWAAG
jgi:hypothetical protein